MANREILKEMVNKKPVEKTIEPVQVKSKGLPLQIVRAVQNVYANSVANTGNVGRGEFNNDPTKKLNGWAKSNL